MRRKRKIEDANGGVLGENADLRMMGSLTDTRVVGNTADSAMGEIANTRAQPLSPRTSEDPSTGETIELEYPFSSTPGSQAPGTENTRLFDDVLLGWSTVLNGGLEDTYGFDERHAEEIFGALRNTQPELSQQQQLSPISQAYPKVTSHPSFSQPTSSSNPPGIEPGYNERSLSPSSRTYTTQFSVQNSATTTPPPQMMPTDSGHNSQCVIACSQIICSLEKYQVDKLKVLDLILGIVKRVTERLDPLVNGQFGCPDTKCLALFNIIMYQLVEILEVGTADFLADTSDAQRPLSSELLEAGFHELDFSGLGLGYKDQERFRSQIILEVLRPVFKIMQKVLFISTNAGLDRDNGYQDRENRLKALVEKVKKRSGCL
ncbi:hypothetical protein UA08_03201 [Talaromyces atroroseus]|uniref:Aflatoxin regulatory protein domain-containing protein n=1 Tax=Talaromyces atroroseus TaxID=1441469 RepID=A0A225B4J0_TALAT|nr:hypothetical protein UA08_03201 [Talaromyces atroroseus]OKL60847.1 hypothetical protein UA08_03201 [Talaromyces atroroseus]